MFASQAVARIATYLANSLRNKVRCCKACSSILSSHGSASTEAQTINKQDIFGLFSAKKTSSCSLIIIAFGIYPKKTANIRARIDSNGVYHQLPTGERTLALPALAVVPNIFCFMCTWNHLKALEYTAARTTSDTALMFTVGHGSVDTDGWASVRQYIYANVRHQFVTQQCCSTSWASIFLVSLHFKSFPSGIVPWPGVQKSVYSSKEWVNIW